MRRCAASPARSPINVGWTTSPAVASNYWKRRPAASVALVRGNRDYTVLLTSYEGALDYSCDCPIGSDGAFCKHCVAAALAWLNRDAAPARPSVRRKAREVTLADAARILQLEDTNTLAKIMIDWAKDDVRSPPMRPDTAAAAV